MKKRKVLTSQTMPGMLVAEDIYTLNNQLIITAGTLVTDRVITRLKFYSIPHIFISEDANIPEAPVPESDRYSAKVRQTTEFKHFSAALNSAVDIFRDQISSIASNEEIDEDALLDNIRPMLSCARNGAHLFDMLHCLRDFDDETYRHCINVAMISYVLGKWLNFTRRDLDTLMLCGLLHDLGKILIAPEILRKPTSLTDEEYAIMQTHSVQGYNILRAQKANIHVQMSAMMHHERCDGSGYPMGLKSEQIDRFAKVVMIADVYEAMTAARVYRGPLCPFEVIGIFESEGLAKYDTHFVMTFLERINQTYLHNNVRLSDKTEGVIVMINPTYLSHPVVKVGSKFIDLSKEPDLYIEAII